MKTQSNFYRLMLGMLALVIAFAPLATFAKENGKDKSKEDKKVVQASRMVSATFDKKSDDRSCLKAFGHFIAPGWKKNNASTTVSLKENCFLPFGIAKKFHGSTTIGTSTAPSDVTAPVISDATSTPNHLSALITWKTDERAQSAVFYATSSGAVDVHATSTARVSDKSLEKDHSLKISGLQAGTTYYFKIVSKDKAGNTAVSQTLSFTTKAYPVVVTHPVISQVATLIGSTTVGIAWKTNEAATTKVYYGTTTPDIGSPVVSYVIDSALVKDHSITVGGLSTSTNYTFVLESKNASGNATHSNSFTIKTTSGI